MREDVIDKLKTIGLIGATVGLIMSAIFGTYVTFAGVHFLHSIGAPLYGTPPVDLTVTNETTYYQEGDKAPEFRNLTWKDDYRVYQITVTNEGKDLIRDLDIYMPLPGCAVYTEKQGPGVGGDFTDENALAMRLSTGVRDGVDVYHCGKRFSSENLGPGEGFSTRVVVKQEFDECDLLVGYNPRPRLRIKYSWTENGIRLSENTTVRLKGLEGEYQRASTQRVSTGTQGPGSRIEGIYFTTILLGVNSDTLNSGIEKCQAERQDSLDTP